MPDPLLTMTDFNEAFRRANDMAEHLGARLSRDGEQLFLECAGPRDQAMLARIDCTGYPMRPPDVRFLNPSVGHHRDAKPSPKASHWPARPAPMNRNGSLHLCIAGTQSYLLWHPGHTRAIDLGSLVVALTWACRAESRRPVAARRR